LTVFLILKTFVIFVNQNSPKPYCYVVANCKNASTDDDGRYRSDRPYSNVSGHKEIGKNQNETGLDFPHISPQIVSNDQKEENVDRDPDSEEDTVWGDVKKVIFGHLSVLLIIDKV
jgi:hypothetical protein